MCRRFNSGSRHRIDMQIWPPPTGGDPPRPRPAWDRIAHRFAVQIVALALALALLSAIAPGIVSLPPFGQIEYLATLIAFAAILAAVNIVLRLASALFVREAPVQVHFIRGRGSQDPDSGSEPD